jgi:hypothetical protein
VLRAGSDALGGEKALRLLVHVAEPIAASKALEALRDFQAARRGSEGLYALFERLQCLRCTAPSFCSLLLDEWVIGKWGRHALDDTRGIFREMAPAGVAGVGVRHEPPG